MFVNFHTCTLFRDCGMPVMISKFDDSANIFDRLEHGAGAELLTIEQMDYTTTATRESAFGLLMELIATFRSGGDLCPDREFGEQFVLKTFGITPDEIIALAQEPAFDAD